MKRTDYGSIAAQYDANVARHRIPKDAALADRLATARGLARMRSALAHDPAATIADELALVEARATLR